MLRLAEVVQLNTFGNIRDVLTPTSTTIDLTRLVLVGQLKFYALKMRGIHPNICPGCGIVTKRGRYCPKCGREVSGEKLTELAKQGRVALSSGAQAVKLTIGRYSVTIPAGSFVRHKEGYAFEGVIKGASLEALIKFGKTPGSYRLLAEGRGANLSGTTNPVTVTLSVGDNLGTTHINAEFEGSKVPSQLIDGGR